MEFKREKATMELCQEMMPLLKKHWEEISNPDLKDIQVLKPDFEKYIAAENEGNLMVFTIRNPWTLVGYWVWIVQKNLHYSTTRQAYGDVLFLDKEHRGTGTGFKFMKWCVEQV